MNPGNPDNRANDPLRHMRLVDPNPELELDLRRRLRDGAAAAPVVRAQGGHVIRVLAALAACTLIAVIAMTFFDGDPVTKTNPSGDRNLHFLTAGEFRDNVRVAGIFSNTVIIEDIYSGEQTLHGLGDELHGYVIAAIHPDRVEFAHRENAGDSFALKLTNGRAAEGDTPVIESFELTGILLDTDGAPVAGWVSAYDASGIWLTGAMTGKDGAWRLNLRAAVAFLQAGDAIYQRLTKRVGNWKSSASIDLILDASKSFVIRGAVTNADGAAAAPGTQVVAWHGPRQRASIGSTNENGMYEIHANAPVLAVKARVPHVTRMPDTEHVPGKPISMLRTDLLTVQRDGFWNADATVDLKLDPNTLFTVEGRVIHQINGQPSNDEDGTLRSSSTPPLQIAAYDEAGEWISSTTAPNTGAYALTACRPISRLVVSMNGMASAMAFDLQGHWYTSATQDIVIDHDRFFTLSGAVRDANAAPAGAILAALLQLPNGREIPLCDIATAQNGEYSILFNGEISALSVCMGDRWRTFGGPWHASDRMDFDLGLLTLAQQLHDVKQKLSGETTFFEACLALQELVSRYGSAPGAGVEAAELLRGVQTRYGDRLLTLQREYEEQNRRFQDTLQALQAAGSVLPLADAETHMQTLQDIAKRAANNRLGAAADRELTALRNSMAGVPLIGFTPGADNGDGCAIASVLDNTAAAKAGLQAGDRIVKLDSDDVTNFQSLYNALSRHKVGESVTLEVVRADGLRFTTTLTLGRRLQ